MDFFLSATFPKIDLLHEDPCHAGTLKAFYKYLCGKRLVLVRWLDFGLCYHGNKDNGKAENGYVSGGISLDLWA